jgi:hypothetical protein
MIDKIIQSLEENTESLQRFIWAGEYTGYPDWWTMSQLIREIGEGLSNLRSSVKAVGSIEREVIQKEAMNG